MKIARSTRYALSAALEMAEEGQERPVTAAEVAAKHGFPETVVAKAFQQLVRAGIARGTRGVRGGYRLAKRASQITVLDVIAAFEPASVQNEAPIPSSFDPRIERLFEEVDGLVQATFASVTLETLIGGRKRS